MERQRAFEIVKECFQNFDVLEIKETDHLKDDLKFDSLDIVQLTIEIDNYFPNKEAANLDKEYEKLDFKHMTIKDIVDIVAKVNESK
jgi:acyl carrier protein